MRHAVVKNGIVVNIIEWDGVTEWAPPPGCTTVPDEKLDSEMGGFHGHKGFERLSEVTVDDLESLDEKPVDLAATVAELQARIDAMEKASTTQSWYDWAKSLLFGQPEPIDGPAAALPGAKIP